MKNLVHTIASSCLLVWLVGFFFYHQNGWFHFTLLIAVIAAVGRFLMEKQGKRKVKSG